MPSHLRREAGGSKNHKMLHKRNQTFQQMRNSAVAFSGPFQRDRPASFEAGQPGLRIMSRYFTCDSALPKAYFKK